MEATRTRSTAGRSGRVSTAVICAVFVLSGCPSNDADEQAEILGLADDTIGQCLDFDPSQGADVEQLPFVACTSEHSHEIFGIVDAEGVGTDNVYPGFDALELDAQVDCLGLFEPYVGVSAFDSSLFYSWIVPSLTTWTDKNDRQILCVTGSGDGRRLIGSVMGTAI